MPTQSETESSPGKEYLSTQRLSFEDGHVKYSDLEGGAPGGCSFDHMQQLINSGTTEVVVEYKGGRNVLVKEIGPNSIHGVFEGDAEKTVGSAIESLQGEIEAGVCTVTMRATNA